MRNEGLRPNVITYAAVMAACKEKPAVVLDLLERMKEEGIETNTILLTSAINSLARGGGEYTGIMIDYTRGSDFTTILQMISYII